MVWGRPKREPSTSSHYAGFGLRVGQTGFLEGVGSEKLEKAQQILV